jgi:proline iminopeptidase
MNNECEVGFVKTTHGHIWFKKIRGSPNPPLLVLHGGPGIPHDYLENLEILSRDRPVIFYDQLGCGRSDRPTDPSLWRIERFVEELEEVCSELALGPMHLFGSSWGTMLAVDYALKYPSRLKSLILSSSCLKSALWQEDAEKLCAAMGEEWTGRRKTHERLGTTDSQDYAKLNLDYFEKYICRLKPVPDAFKKALSAANLDVYRAMWGVSEFFITGNLRDYDRTVELGQIDCPILLVCGRFDEATPESTALFASKAKFASTLVLENSAHFGHLEEPEKYFSALSSFMSDHDR